MNIDVALCSTEQFELGVGWLLIIDCHSSGVCFETEEKAQFAAQDLVELLSK
jgi:hypothetical protein